MSRLDFFGASASGNVNRRLEYFPMHWADFSKNRLIYRILDIFMGVFVRLLYFSQRFCQLSDVALPGFSGSAFVCYTALS